MTKINMFNDSLVIGESNKELIEGLYKKFIPNLLSVTRMKSEKSNVQSLGVDTVILTESGKAIIFEEKLRTNKYDDFLFEFTKNDVSNAPGWIEESKLCDYILYVFLSSQEAYVLDWLTLQRVWSVYKTKWLKSYPIIKAKNYGYNSLNVAVPIAVVLETMARASSVKV